MKIISDHVHAALTDVMAKMWIDGHITDWDSEGKDGGRVYTIAMYDGSEKVVVTYAGTVESLQAVTGAREKGHDT